MGSLLVFWFYLPLRDQHTFLQSKKKQNVCGTFTKQRKMLKFKNKAQHINKQNYLVSMLGLYQELNL